MTRCFGTITVGLNKPSKYVMAMVICHIYFKSIIQHSLICSRRHLSIPYIPFQLYKKYYKLKIILLSSNIDLINKDYIRERERAGDIFKNNKRM